jgi:hypothetical protein
MDLPIAIEPQPRIDTLVTDAASGAARRRTEYTGVAWFGGKPELTSWGIAATGRPVRFGQPFYLPDSLPYDFASAAAATIACSVAVRSAPADSHHLVEASAAIVPDPRSPGVGWLQVRLAGAAQAPLAVTYRVDVLVAPEAVLVADPGATAG